MKFGLVSYSYPCICCTHSFSGLLNLHRFWLEQSGIRMIHNPVLQPSAVFFISSQDYGISADVNDAEEKWPNGVVNAGGSWFRWFPVRHGSLVHLYEVLPMIYLCFSDRSFGQIFFLYFVFMITLRFVDSFAYIRRLCIYIIYIWLYMYMFTCVYFLNKDWRIMDVCLCTAVRAEMLEYLDAQPITIRTGRWMRLLQNNLPHTHIYTHTHIYIYIEYT